MKEQALLIYRGFGLGQKLWPLDRNAGSSVLLGVAMAAVCVQAAVGFGFAFRCFDGVADNTQEILWRLALATGAALLLPVCSETVFRGMVQNPLTKLLGWRASWILTALVFLGLHLIFQPPVQKSFLPGATLNLFLLGLILGGIYLRAGTLWLNAGLYGGFLLAVLVFPALARPSAHPTYPLLSGDLASNPITSAVLVLLGLWLWRFYRHPSFVPETGPSAG